MGEMDDELFGNGTGQEAPQERSVQAFVPKVDDKPSVNENSLLIHDLLDKWQAQRVKVHIEYLYYLREFEAAYRLAKALSNSSAKQCLGHDYKDLELLTENCDRRAGSSRSH